MEEPPCANRRSNHQQPKNLISPEQATLLFARNFRGLLLIVRLDARLDQRVCLMNLGAPATSAHPASV
jgi:hypothetical protein